MKTLLLLLFFIPNVYAQEHALETTTDSIYRHSAERYETYSAQGSAPLGGYSEKLGDSAPYGTREPGYSKY